MASNPNFVDILDAPMESAERPKPLPVGTYTFLIDGQPKIDKSKNGTQFAEFVLKALRPGEDIDAQELEDFGGAGKVQGKTIRNTFWLTEDSIYRLKEFATLCGVEINGKNIRQVISELPGCQVNGLIRQVPTQDGQGFRAEIKSFSAV